MRMTALRTGHRAPLEWLPQGLICREPPRRSDCNCRPESQSWKGATRARARRAARWLQWAMLGRESACWRPLKRLHCQHSYYLWPLSCLSAPRCALRLTGRHHCKLVLVERLACQVSPAPRQHDRCGPRQRLELQGSEKAQAELHCRRPRRQQRVEAGLPSWQPPRLWISWLQWSLERRDRLSLSASKSHTSGARKHLRVASLPRRTCSRSGGPESNALHTGIPCART